MYSNIYEVFEARDADNIAWTCHVRKPILSFCILPRVLQCSPVLDAMCGTSGAYSGGHRCKATSSTITLMYITSHNSNCLEMQTKHESNSVELPNQVK